MRRRSQLSHPGEIPLALPSQVKKPQVTKVTFQASFVSSDMCERRKVVEKVFQEAYDEPGKPLQVDTVMLLAQCSNTFILAGTSFGKTRIAEAYLKIFKKKLHPIVLVLNPLDVLGDNQVG